MIEKIKYKLCVELVELMHLKQEREFMIVYDVHIVRLDKIDLINIKKNTILMYIKYQ